MVCLHKPSKPSVFPNSKHILKKCFSTLPRSETSPYDQPDILSRRSNNEPTREKASSQRISENSRAPVPAQALPFSRHFIIDPTPSAVKRRGAGRTCPNERWRPAQKSALHACKRQSRWGKKSIGFSGQSGCLTAGSNPFFHFCLFPRRPLPVRSRFP